MYTDNLLNHLVKAAWLLRECGLEKQSSWFEERINLLNSQKISRDQKEKIIDEIDKILAGMGLFLDLPLIPIATSSLSKEKARSIQWDLVEKISNEIEKIKEHNQ